MSCLICGLRKKSHNQEANFVDTFTYTHSEKKLNKIPPHPIPLNPFIMRSLPSRLFLALLILFLQGKFSKDIIHFILSRTTNLYKPLLYVPSPWNSNSLCLWIPWFIRCRCYEEYLIKVFFLSAFLVSSPLKQLSLSLTIQPTSLCLTTPDYTFLTLT